MGSEQIKPSYTEIYAQILLTLAVEIVNTEAYVELYPNI